MCLASMRRSRFTSYGCRQLGHPSTRHIDISRCVQLHGLISLVRHRILFLSCINFLLWLAFVLPSKVLRYGLVASLVDELVGMRGIGRSDRVCLWIGSSVVVANGLLLQVRDALQTSTIARVTASEDSQDAPLSRVSETALVELALLESSLDMMCYCRCGKVLLAIAKRLASMNKTSCRRNETGLLLYYLRTDLTAAAK